VAYPLTPADPVAAAHPTATEPHSDVVVSKSFWPGGNSGSPTEGFA